MPRHKSKAFKISILLPESPFFFPDLDIPGGKNEWWKVMKAVTMKSPEFILQISTATEGVRLPFSAGVSGSQQQFSSVGQTREG